MKESTRIFACDFETTVYEGQTSTEVWAAAIVELGTEDVHIFNNIHDFWRYVLTIPNNITLYFHNLKFDGSFLVPFFMESKEYRVVHTEKKNMNSSEFNPVISSMGQWYSIRVKHRKRFIDIRDSLKLLPFSLARIGKAFDTKHKKLEMEYTGYRYAGCNITDEELHYICNDVLVLKEALEFMQEQGHMKLTIGACCLKEFVETIHRDTYKWLFPDLSKSKLDESDYGCDNAERYIRNSYRGGWCYKVKGRGARTDNHGCTYDVNSLYPSMMHSCSGNRYPIGKPTFWKGNTIPDEAKDPNSFYFVRFTCRFYLKNGKLPFVQIKNNLLYSPTDCLITSDVYHRASHSYLRFYKDRQGVLHDTKVTLTMTQTDFELFLEHYYVEEMEILDGCHFDTDIGIFDKYIDKYAQIKATSKGAKRELAKLFLNNLYGKLASSNISSYKMPYLDNDGVVHYEIVTEYNKKFVYIPVGSAITSYARNFTIRAAQQNYYGHKKPGFYYADTDSIHCDLPPSEIKGIIEHPTNFCCWKLESQWDYALFVRQKTYIEHVTHEGNEPCTPFHLIKCAGLPERCKDLFRMSIDGYNEAEYNKLSEAGKEFVSVKRSIDDFKIGLKIPCKLLPKQIPGGVVLQETTFEMR